MSYKALEIFNEMNDALAKRLPALLQTVSFDASTPANPCVLIGAAAAGSKGAFIRVEPIVWSTATDILGLAQTVYTPHVIQIAIEANPAGGAGADVNDWPTLLPILGDIISRGCRVELWLETNGTAPSLTTFSTATKLKASFDNLYQGLLSQQ